MNVLLVTKLQLNKLEFILNRVFGTYFKGEATFEAKDIKTFDTDIKYISQEVGGKYVINASKLKRLYDALTTNQKNKIKARFSNVNLRTWINNNVVDFETIELINTGI